MMTHACNHSTWEFKVILMLVAKVGKVGHVHDNCIGKANQTIMGLVQTDKQRTTV